jgi:hypothetical protein
VVLISGSSDDSPPFEFENRTQKNNFIQKFKFYSQNCFIIVQTAEMSLFDWLFGGWKVLFHTLLHTTVENLLRISCERNFDRA